MLGDMAWYLPVLIFLARIGDVSIGTVRLILVISGRPYISAILGFFEVIIWVLAVGGVIAHLTNPIALVAYAGGFATGVIFGMFIEERMALGYRIVRAISTDKTIQLSERLRDRGWYVTHVDGKGRSGPVDVAFLFIKRREMTKLRHDIHELDPKAYLSVSHADRPTNAMLTPDSRFGRLTWLKGLAMRK
jgi:uncharacterized protein YebE (UPF0316 family)